MLPRNVSQSSRGFPHCIACEPAGNFNLCFRKFVYSTRKLANSFANACCRSITPKPHAFAHTTTKWTCSGYTPPTFSTRNTKSLRPLVRHSILFLLRGKRFAQMKRKGPSHQNEQRSLTDFFCPPAKRGTSTIEPVPDDQRQIRHGSHRLGS